MIMTNPFFSIVLPTYNRANVLNETITSVINQSFVNWELLVIDDGSTDNTKVIVESYSDVRIKYFYQDNQERSIARNNGIKHAKGGYICFLDSDDIILDNHLQVLFDFIRLNAIKDALLFTSFAIKKNGVLKDIPLIKLEGNPLDYFLRNPVIPTRVCLSKRISMEFEFREDAIVTEDTIYWIEVSNKYPVYQIPEKTVYYCLHDDNSVNISNDGYIKTLKGLNNFRKDKPELFKKISKKIRINVVSELYFGISKYYIFKGNRFLSVINLLKSFMINPFHHQFKHRMLIFLLLLSVKLDKIKIKLWLP